jgi:tRNA (guanine-N7-)-methyltransferase
MSNVRLREHVNPLSNKYANPADLPDWHEVFADADRPLLLDIGCAKGEFPLAMAHAQPDWNFLGIEIREPLVHQANEWVKQQGLTNLHFLFGNANNTLQPLLASLPTGILQQVTIQFPDPWFKRRHNKRRVVQPGRVAELAQYLAPDRTVFVQSDVLEVAEEMVRLLPDTAPTGCRKTRWRCRPIGSAMSSKAAVQCIGPYLRASNRRWRINA